MDMDMNMDRLFSFPRTISSRTWSCVLSQGRQWSLRGSKMIANGPTAGLVAEFEKIRSCNQKNKVSLFFSAKQEETFNGYSS